MGCVAGQQHVAHDFCLVKELASLKIINITCTICNGISQPTIHETLYDGVEIENNLPQLESSAAIDIKLYADLNNAIDDESDEI